MGIGGATGLAATAWLGLWFTSPGCAQVPPCADEPRAGVPACGDERSSRPVALARVFSDDFERPEPWTTTGEVTWYLGEPEDGGFSVLLGDGGSITATIPLINRSSPLVAFRMAARGLEGSGASAVAEYFDGSRWKELARVPVGGSAGALKSYMVSLREVQSGADFKLRFGLAGQGGLAVIDDVSVWAQRIVPPP